MIDDKIIIRRYNDLFAVYVMLIQNIIITNVNSLLFYNATVRKMIVLSFNESFLDVDKQQYSIFTF